MEGPATRMRDVTLRIKCLCGCGSVTGARANSITMETEIEEAEVIPDHLLQDPDRLGWVWVIFDPNNIGVEIHGGAGRKFQIRGETADAVIGIPCLTLDVAKGKWRTHPDSTGAHYAVRRK